MPRADVDEVNVDAVDRRHELRQGVELRFGLPPVVVRAPVAHELLQLRELHALRLVGDGLLVGPARRRNAPAKIDELLLRNIDLEGPNCVVIAGNKVCWQQADGTRGC